MADASTAEFRNVYDDARRARTYAKLEFPGTYYLAYRDLPKIIEAHVRGRRALDFGCGAGRSTRFLRALGFEAVGVDVARDMIRIAEERDPGGDYRLIREGDFEDLEAGAYNLVLSAFTFDSIAGMDNKVSTLRRLRGLLATDGCIVSIVSAPEIYVNEWASFSTRAYPENRWAKSGDRVRIVITATEDPRPVEDIVWSDEAYHATYAAAGLTSVETLRPLAVGSEPYAWVNETRIAPWVIYVLKKLDGSRAR
ncbi:MAG TPA: class I SAM-dependent methyltransferase [bacterium]|nr:class I SAM-dependent methyltransferase [bacterium]